MNTLLLSELDEVGPGWGHGPSPAVTRAIDALRHGSPVVVGQRAGALLVLAGASACPAGTAALVRHGSGLVFVAMEQQRLQSLQIPPMPTDPDSKCPKVHVAVDAAAGIGTGISAIDRAETIRLLSDRASKPDTFARPGHVLPVGASLHLGAAPDDADLALVLAWLAGAQPAAAAFCALVSIEQPTGMSGPLEAAAIAASRGYPYVDSAEITHAYYRRAPQQHNTIRS
jgi:3,4-dihydroxy 2-butanone 4-phosphate synthase/GTP cyclohydrolase II